MNKFKLLLAVALALPLAVACGKLETPKKLKKETQPITQAKKLTDAKYRKLCTAAGGQIRGGHCLTVFHKELTPNHTGYFEIVPQLELGQFVTAAAELNDGRVNLVLNGEFFMDFPVRYPVTKAGPKLGFFVNNPGYKGVSASVWTCFNDVLADPDKEVMTRVGCPPTGVIP